MSQTKSSYITKSSSDHVSAQRKAFILEKVKQYNFDAIQLHGAESAEYCLALNKELKEVSTPLDLTKTNLSKFVNKNTILLFHNFNNSLILLKNLKLCSLSGLPEEPEAEKQP